MRYSQNSVWGNNMKEGYKNALVQGMRDVKLRWLAPELVWRL